MAGLLDMALDDGEAVEKDYDEGMEDLSSSAKDSVFNVGYGKANVHGEDLKIQSPSIFVPNGRQLVDAMGNPYRAGYHSFSALGTYRRCQRAYYWKYVEKLRFPESAVKMWGGSAMHNVLEDVLDQKMGNPKLMKTVRDMTINTEVQRLAGVTGTPKFSLDDLTIAYGNKLEFTNESVKKDFSKYFREFADEYNKGRDRIKTEGGLVPPEIAYGTRIPDETSLFVKYKNAVDAYIATEFPRVHPLSIEKLMVHHLDIYTGGTVPIVGFIDLEEKTDFMGSYHKDLEDIENSAKPRLSAEEIELGKAAIKSIDNGETMITDHKCGMAKSYETARTNQQLTLYSMATNTPVVGFDSLTLGTTGGKNPAKATPAVVHKYFARRTEKDYEELTNDFNAIIGGISEGRFDKSGMDNPMVCSPTLCAYYSTKCFKKH